MTAGRVTGGSVWIETGPPQPEFPRLEEDVRADIAVIGGGIVGITTALALQEAGADVVLLDAGRLGHGVSGHTTAKVSSQHGMIYARLRARFGADGARTYARSNEGALAWIADRVHRDAIDCDFRRRESYAYVTFAGSRSLAEDEASAARAAGLPATLVESAPLPYPVEAAVRFDDQAEFHVRRYLLALIEALRRAGGRIYEHSRAVEVDTDESCVVKTPGGRVTAGQVVVATHYRRLESFARQHWDVRSLHYRWSAQDNTTVDGVPYVGGLTPLADRVFMATGFAKWGMTGGTAAALLLTDLLLGRDNPAARLFDPNRLKLRASATRVWSRRTRRPGCASSATGSPSAGAGRSRICSPARVTSCACEARPWPAIATSSACCTPSRRRARTSAAA